MSIDRKTLDSPSYSNENLQSKMQLDTKEQLEALKKSRESQVSETRLEELTLLSAVEKWHYESLKEKGREIVAQNISAYFNVVGRKFDKNDWVANSKVISSLEDIIEAIAQFYSAQKMPFWQKESDFISRLDPESLKVEYEKVQEYYARSKIEHRRASIDNYKRAEAEKKDDFASWIDITPIDDKIQDAYAQVQTAKWNQFTRLASKDYDFSPTAAIAKKNEASPDKSERGIEISGIYDKFLANSKSEWDREILEWFKNKIAINQETWELTLKEAVKFWEDWELVLSPDKKWVTLRWYWYEYKFPTLDAKNLEISLNKISSLRFMENTWLTAFTPNEMRDISLNLNKYFDITNWIPINLDKPEWLTQAEKIELLAIFSKLKVIWAYDPHNLSKRIITKTLFINNLKNNTNFYKWQWQLNIMAFDLNIKNLVSKKDPQNQVA
ncbi:MAG: hypothetical protein ACD_3C00027G0006 [uncultured bacterium (gcode 4)]|uniref:Uncharacterized protein n=1 Tax=uncultured bacterium (gcode 4) TaxID=1234023 RepID=K2G0F5_9BACT|nr:MAG: hypothetical protein ACD_3C00027G0006 [uncultured bacterium (gcode 4)]